MYKYCFTAIFFLQSNYFLFTVTKIFSLAIIANSLSVLNSDGYKVLMSFLSYNRKRDNSKNLRWIKIVGIVNILFCIYRFLIIISRNELDVFALLRMLVNNES
jgi:hypothetical protein